MAGTNSAGNNRKSRAQHERDGTFRKDRHGDLKNPEPSPGRPEPPGELDNLGQQTWARMIWAFEDMGMLHKVDGDALYAYCQLYAETEAVKEQQGEAKAGLRVLEENLSTRPETPEERLSAADKVQLFAQIVTLHKIISKCTDQLRSGRMAIRQYLVEFGLTPASRSRIKLPAKTETVDAFTAFQQARIARVK